ncbi:hypothetical protein AB0E12_18535 [Micromonospora chersina]|uniref:hypothetical protein n=1 Tax=Micromonospora chersina TaxID=47854 RepID=UPI0033E15441
MTDTQQRPSAPASFARGVLAGLVANILGVMYLCGTAAGWVEGHHGLTAAVAIFMLVSVSNHVLDRFKDRLPARVSRINDLVGKALVVIGLAAVFGISFAVFVLGSRVFN